MGQAQTISTFDSHLTLAPADTPAPASGKAGEESPDQEAELAKKLNNPVASLISVPIQNNWDFGIGPANAMKYTANIQPVIPISISEDWNVIVRTILPVIYAESPIPGGGSTSGLGDVTQSFFFSPKEPVGGWILGAGPAGYYPTATDSELGGGKWGVGPTIVALRQEHGFTYGILANQIWSVAGWGAQDISATYLQPFVAFTTKTYTTFALNTESTYDWETRDWTVPVNFMVQQLVKIGRHPVAFQVGYRYYAERPAGGPDWGLRFTATFLFPK
ncbi:MAG: transporter [Verrucomicrobia subdivision 3 bacterium]|nr:transporter [Verrucomicrobiota bacterium]MCC6822035.1 transporter [Limisphaerales bacterium]